MYFILWFPQIISNLLFPEWTGSFTFFHEFAMVMTFIPLTSIFLVARKKGLSIFISILITLLVILNPFLYSTMTETTVTTGLSLLPVIYLMYLERRKWWTVFFMVIISFVLNVIAVVINKNNQSIALATTIGFYVWFFWMIVVIYINWIISLFQLKYYG
jgi:phosphatidylglycerophosphate synthase